MQIPGRYFVSGIHNTFPVGIYLYGLGATIVESIPYMILTFISAFILAYACLKLYDEPVRKWLTDRFLKGKKK